MTTRSLASDPPRPHFSALSGRALVDAQGSHEPSYFTRLPSCNRIALLTEGYSTPEFAKSAIQLLRYREADIVAVIDSEHVGLTAQDLFGVGGTTPVVGVLEDAGDLDSVFLGIAPPGGRLPTGWSDTLARAARNGLRLVSGLHDRLADAQGLSAVDVRADRLFDLRSNSCRRVAEAPTLLPQCVRVLTVGSDCSVGKMSAAKEIELGLLRRGRDAKFLATGQTGLMIGGVGVVIDAVVSDFINGTVERLVVENQGHELLLIEGQGSIVHPAYSAVSVGLLHGSAPDGLVLCHELGRDHLKSAKHVPTHSLMELIRLHELFATPRHPCKVIGLALNGRRLDEDAAAEQIEQISVETGLPACDVYRDGPDRLVDAVEAFDRALRLRRGLLTRTEAAL